MSDELPAPEFSLELTICRCKKTHCANNQCSCRKHKLVCTEACLCTTCDNEALSFEDIGSEQEQLLLQILLDDFETNCFVTIIAARTTVICYVFDPKQQKLSKFCNVLLKKISFLAISLKISILGHILLHKLYINVAIANILLYL